MSADPQDAFLDELSAPALLALLGRPGRYRVRWFDRATPAGRTVAAIASRAGRLAGLPERVREHVGAVRDEHGRSRFIRTLRAARALTDRIRDEWLRRLPFPESARWPADHVRHHLERVVELDVRTECHRVVLARWIAGGPGAIILIADRPWGPFLVSFAGEHGLSLRTYRRPPAVTSWVRDVRRAGALAAALRRGATRRVAAPAATGAAAPAGPRVGIRAWSQALEARRDRRSDVFWTDDDLLPLVTLYDAAPGVGPGGTAARVIPRPDAPGGWRPSPAYPARAASAVFGIARSHALRVLGARGGGWVARRLIGLAIERAYWEDLFRATGIRVNLVSFVNGSVAQALALRDLGGISLTYQTSASDLYIASALLTAGEDVRFVFSREFERVFAPADVPGARYRSIGFLYGHAARDRRSDPGGRELRRRLERSGARTVIAYFDENSSDRWDSPASHAEAASDLTEVLRRVIDDPSVGLIVKPKRPADLRVRVRDALATLDRALATGRCIVVEDTTVYPAEVAVSADLVVGKLQGVTAALESVLAGVPSVLVAAPNHWDHPLADLLGPNVVFATWDDLWARIGREHAAGPLSIGGWGEAVRLLDDRGDGGAAGRLSAFVRVALSALAAGASPRSALERADAALAP